MDAGIRRRGARGPAGATSHVLGSDVRVIESAWMSPDVRWSFPRRLGLLSLGCFLVLVSEPQLLTAVPVRGYELLSHEQALWNKLVAPLGEAVLGEPITILPNGSGDTTWNYVQMALMVAISLIVGVALALVDRRRHDYRALREWLVVMTRYALGPTLCTYGIVKVIQTQFMFPGLSTLSQRVGDLSPMGLAWTFMGYSTGYNLFTGGAELLAGLLLLSRRTAPLGALVAIGVMANVVALNFCYDIPVKLFSATLLLMAVFVAAPALRPLLTLLVLRRPAALPEDGPPITGALRFVRLAVKLVIAASLTWTVLDTWKTYETWGPGAIKADLHGLYRVERFSLHGVELPPLKTDPIRWDEVIVDSPRVMQVRGMTGEWSPIPTRHDAATRTLRIARDWEEDAPQFKLTYERPAEDTLILRGAYWRGPIDVRLKRVDVNEFLLVRRGFHWVNEYPFNR